MKTHLTLGLLAAAVLASPQRNIAKDTKDIKESKDTKDAIKEPIKTEKEPYESRSCSEVMGNNGLNSSSFWHGAAHGLHSINLEEIREWFEPEASVNNKIPNVNSNLSAEQTILFNAPLAGYDTDFKTMSLKVMAFFMLNDRPDFYQRSINTLEKLTHVYHMHEIYAAAAPIYQRMKENPPTDLELCPCVNDITGNGILTELVYIAKKLKDYGIKRGGRKDYYYEYKHTAASIEDDKQAGRIDYLYEYKHKAASIEDEDEDECPWFDPGCNNGRSGDSRAGRKVTNNEVPISRYQKEYLSDSSKQTASWLIRKSPWKPNTLVGPDQWISYEAMLTKSMLDEEGLNDFAVFMYCKLNTT